LNLQLIFIVAFPFIFITDSRRFLLWIKVHFI